MSPFELITLTHLMRLSEGKPEIAIGLIDGPVVRNHPDLLNANIHEVLGKVPATCSPASSAACMHGTFIAGILSAKRESLAPALCPNCTLLVRPIFDDTAATDNQMPSASPEELADAIIDCVNASARVINLSVALASPSTKGERKLEASLDYSLRRGVIIVVAGGNQGTIGSTSITRHPWVIPVVACDCNGMLLAMSNIGASIGTRGLCAPGENITSLSSDGGTFTSGGTSAAAAFVTGAVALLWSEFPNASAATIKLALTTASVSRHRRIIPPLMDVTYAYKMLQQVSRTKVGA